MADPTISVSAPSVKPTLVALHFLGSSAEQWEPMFAHLDTQFRCVAIDLPGFGAAVDRSGYDVASMAASVAAEVCQIAPEGWLIVGHSMGAKVACAVARLAEDGAAGLEGLGHLVLVAGSPPSPEPMKDSKRNEMCGWFRGDEAESRTQAQGYIRDNVAAALPDEREQRLVEAVLQANRAAWVAWLDGGSREDWSDKIGRLRTPALILSGAEDAALGPDVQKRVMSPHFTTALFHTLPDTGHLLPCEQPGAVADAIATFVGKPQPSEPDLPADYRALIDSPRVDPRTRSVLLARAEPVPVALDPLPPAELRTLRALVERIVPQRDERQIDIAARMLRRLTGEEGDGWRFAELPDDMAAFRSGLRNLDAIAMTLDAAGYAFLPDAQQKALLEALATGKLTSPVPPTEGRMTAHQLELWFEDMRSLATQIYVAHPVTAARIGFSGIANRGDGAGPQGFTAIGLNRREDWEPPSLVGVDA